MGKPWIVVVLATLAIAGIAAWTAIDARHSHPPAAHQAPESQPLDQPSAEPLARQNTDSTSARAEIANAQSAPTEEPRSLASARATLVLTVLAEEDGTPLEGALLLLGPERSGEPFVVDGHDNRRTTDSTGRARAEIPSERRVRVRTQSAFHAPANLLIEPLAPGETREVELRLATRADLHFVARVVADETGSPLPEASASIGQVGELIPRPGALAALLAKGRKSPGSNAPEHVAVDAEGYFEVDAFSWRPTAARVEAPGFAFTLADVGSGHATRATALEVRLARSATLEVLALDRKGGAVPDVLVRLATRSYELFAATDDALGWTRGAEMAAWEATTGGDGRARIEGLPPGVSFEVSATAKDQPTQRSLEALELLPGEVRAIEIALGAGATLSGRLLEPDGAPAPASEIWLKPRGDLGYAELAPHESGQVRKAPTDEQGRFRFENVSDGAYVVGLAPSEEHPPCLDQVVVRGGVAEREVLLTLWNGLYIRGTVLDPAGQPCKSKVVASSAVRARPESAQSDEQGRFALGPLQPGAYELVATVGYGADNLFANSSPVRADAGDDGVTLALRAGCSIAGRVVDAATGKPTRASLEIAPAGPGDDGSGRMMLSISPSGAFALGALEPGTYTLVATTSGYGIGLLAGLNLAAGQRLEGLEIPVQPGGLLRVHYDGEQESARVHVLLDGDVVVSGIVGRGSSTSWTVPTQPSRVRMIENSELATRQLEQDISPAAGQVTEIRFGGAKEH